MSLSHLGGSVATCDEPLLQLEVDVGELELSVRAAAPRGRGRRAWRASARCGFPSYQGVSPTHHPRWYSNIAYDNTLKRLKAVLDEFDPARSASRALSPFHWRGASFQRPLQCIRTSYRSNLAARCPSGPRSTFTEYALPTGRGLTCGDGCRWTPEVHRCLRWSGASLPAIWRSVRSRAPI